MTPINYIDEVQNNRLYIKRDDFIPFSFGGNKARKAALFFQEIDSGDYDCVVTYGSSSSNHCRVVSNACCLRGIGCHIISPQEANETTYNSQMMKLFNAEITTVPVGEVHVTIEKKLSDLRLLGKTPFFIEGGGHGNLGTEAYVQCYREIVAYEKKTGIHFDYIFFASGTGTTQAGLVCGQLLEKDKRSIIGVSIARKKPRGRDIIINSIRAYLGDKVAEDQIQQATIFVDDYVTGYGNEEDRVTETVGRVLRQYGIPLDTTYTGKAFWGMCDYIDKEQIKGNNILFIHTGGTPLFFDFLKKMNGKCD